MDNTTEELPNLIKKIREELSLSQEDLARELGVSFATVNRWENGKTTPFKLARTQFDSYCQKMVKAGKLSPDLFQ